MTGTRSKPEQPFWVDDPNPYLPSGRGRIPFAQQTILGLVTCFRISYYAMLWVIAVFFALKYPVVWIGVVVMAGIMLLTFVRVFLLWRKSRGRPTSAYLQQLAKEKTGADLIGSALHTVGHPLLQVNQPVVLGLKGDELSIYGYSSSNPIHTISVRLVQNIQTIVFDEEHVPHTDVIDSTAQALQLTFVWRGNPCMCSFRRMYKVRPIEWYQALQAARLLDGSLPAS